MWNLWWVVVMNWKWIWFAFICVSFEIKNEINLKLSLQSKRELWLHCGVNLVWSQNLMYVWCMMCVWFFCSRVFPFSIGFTSPSFSFFMWCIFVCLWYGSWFVGGDGEQMRCGMVDTWWIMMQYINTWKDLQIKKSFFLYYYY